MNQKKTKNRSKKQRSNKFSQKRLLKIFLLILLFAFLASLSSYFLINSKDKISLEKKDNILEEKKTKNIITDEIKSFQEKKPEDYFDEIIPSNDPYDKFEEYTQALEKDFLEKHNDEVTKLNEKKIEKKVEEVKKDKKTPIKIDEKNIITSKDKYVYNKKDRPKIAIIIDDVSNNTQKNKILDIGYPISMAFLPPTKNHKNSAKIAQDLPFHMIHFPMQASSAFKGPEINTLNITDSYETIEKRVKQLRKWYPTAKYTNNHTGSVFTQNDEAMDKLFRALKKYNFIFVDSRTSSKSVAKKYAKKYNMPYIVRNTFIDNERTFVAIQNQLQKAIDIAKRQGYSIAIGHPHSITLKVLKESKHLLKDVDPIFVNKLPYL